MKYFMDIEILYEKFLQLPNIVQLQKVMSVVIDINNVESITDSDNSKEVYSINNNNHNNSNNIVNNSNNIDCENKNINISDSEDNNTVINNVLNRSIGENHANIFVIFE
jgi:hypothetical protein